MSFRLPVIFATILCTVGCKSSYKLFSKGAGPEGIYSDSVQFTQSKKLIMVPVVINGKTYRFMVDTGAPMVISSEVAQALNLKKVSRRNVGDSQGNHSMLNYYALPNVELGNQVFKNLVAIEADLQAVPALACLQMDGFIGSNMLRHALWTIDYESQTLYFTNDFNATTTDTNALILSFSTKSTFTPMVSFVAGNDTVHNITFDTGSGSGLTLPKSKLPRFDPSQTPVAKSYGRHTSGLFGSVPDTLLYTLLPLTIDGKVVASVPSDIQLSKTQSLLGTAFLENFKVELNWHAKEIKLIPTKTNFENTSYGFGIQYLEEKLVVSSVIDGSTAASFGFEVGDVILAVNGHDSQKVTVAQYCEYVFDAIQHQLPIEITLHEKGTFTVAQELLVK